MSSATPIQGAQQQQNAPPGYAAPAGAPPPAAAPGNPATPGAAPGQPPYPPPGQAPPPGQQPYSVYPPPGAYAAGPQGAYYPPPPGSYYPPPPGQYPQYAGYYPPPPGQYAPYPPPAGQYLPPAGQYPPPAGQYLPPAGYYPPPAGAPGAPGTPGAPSAPAAPAAGQQQSGGAPPPAGAGQYAPPGGPPPAQYAPAPAPYQMPGAPQGAPYYAQPPIAQNHPQDPLVYLGTAIPNPDAPHAPLTVQKVPGYDPAHDYNALVRAISPDGVGDEKKRQSSSTSASASASASVSTSAGTSTSAATSTAGTSATSSSFAKAKPFSFGLNNSVGAMLTLKTDGMKTVLNVLVNLNVFQMDALNDYCLAKTGISLAERLQRCTSGNFGTAIQALALGPLGFDVSLANKAIVRLGTDETLLIELMLGRQAFEIRWLKTAYRLRYGRDLVDEVKSDLSGLTMEMFGMALAAQKPVNPYMPLSRDDPEVKNDAKKLHETVKRKARGWETTFFEIFINRSDLHLAAVIENYSREYKSLSKVIKKEASGTIKEGLLYILHGVKSKRDGRGYWRDGKLLEKSMAGLGTKDNQLIYRLVRAHWDIQHMEAIKDAYQRRYKKPLENRVRGETSGIYRDLLVALIKGPTGPKY